MGKQKKMTAYDIQQLLASKHHDDVFVPECNTGSAHRGCRRMDAWAMRRSWSPMTTIGYEIKVSRQDFLADDKWSDYLPFCHHFSFVCPAGLIRVDEISQNVGLIWVSKNGTRLYTKKKAPRGDVGERQLLGLMTYVLMSRTVIVEHSGLANAKTLPGTAGRRAEYMRELQEREKDQQLGWMINQHIRRRFSEMEKRVRAAERQEAAAATLMDRLATVGIEWTGNAYEVPRIRSQIDALAGVVDDTTIRSLEMAAHKIEGAVKLINDIKKHGG